jgi:hypothetical protein
VKARACTALLACTAVALVLGVTPGAAGPAPLFGPPQRHAAGANPAAVVIADLDGNGRLDLAAANSGAGSVSVFLNGQGSIHGRRDYETGFVPRSLASGDLNGDGKQDLATANFDLDSVSVLLNRGDGTFAAAVDYPAGTFPVSIALGDLNGDGKQDLVTANSGSDTVSVLLNAGDGTYSPSMAYATAKGPLAVALGDLTGDGKADLALVASKDADEDYLLSVLANRGDGTFSPRHDYATGYGPRALAIADLDADGRLDVVTGNYASLSVLLNRNGTFQRRDYRTGGNNDVALADLNGDRRPDVATATIDGVAVFTNQGAGIFDKPEHVGPRLGFYPSAVAIGDLNGDGKPDLVTAEYFGTVSVLVNTTGHCTVPDVTRKTLQDAKHMIAQASCRVGAIRRAYSQDVRRGQVISQKPRFGAVLPKGTKVGLVVSRGARK